MPKVFSYLSLLILFNIPIYAKKMIDKCSVCEAKCGESFHYKKNWTPAEIRLEMYNNKHLVFERSGDSILKLYLDDAIMTYTKDTLKVTEKNREEQNENPFYTVKHYFNFSYKGERIFRIGCYCCAECGKKCE
ncbi:hypothetical protein [Fluviispira vulneris]|uniref:hypothetical protein n=1 Tax=Fluviispira vulneris TaxID=2763012 RepID=UPI001645F9BA|nr:hypothetical protein [Fluviispira vulneris]